VFTEGNEGSEGGSEDWSDAFGEASLPCWGEGIYRR